MFFRKKSFDFHSLLKRQTTFRPLMIAHASLTRTLSCLFKKSHHRYSCKWHQEIQLYSMVQWVGSVGTSLVVTWSVSSNWWDTYHHQLLDQLSSVLIWTIDSNINCVLLCSQFSCPSRLLYIICIERVQWRSSFLFRSIWISSISSVPCVASLNERPVLGTLRPTNSLSCNGWIITTFWTNLQTFCKSGQNTFFRFVSTCSKEIIHK